MQHEILENRLNLKIENNHTSRIKQSTNSIILEDVQSSIDCLVLWLDGIKRITFLDQYYCSKNNKNLLGGGKHGIFSWLACYAGDTEHSMEV